jgi:hypothetical protein
MVLYDPYRRWAPRGICRWEEDRHLFFSAGGQPSRKPSETTQELWNQAKEICAMCPVLKQCARDTLGEEYGVFGGLDEHQRYLIRRRLYQAIWRWPEERRMAWARELWMLRQHGLTYGQILSRTGIPAGAAETLVGIWSRHLAEQAESEVVDLELPEAAAEDGGKPPFPGRPGQRHAWVRSGGLVRDAWYRGETPDGVWISVQTWAGRGRSVNKWIPAEDVCLYNPQPAVVMNYYGRPDTPEAFDATA